MFRRRRKSLAEEDKSNGVSDSSRRLDWKGEPTVRRCMFLKGMELGYCARSAA